jgi:cyclopropane-fatty-acyl-phospholipid synthase
MAWLSLEHSKAAYWADFGVYGTVLGGLLAWLLVQGPADRLWQTAALVLAGLAAWTAIEYGLHRFLLHGVQPFARWHAEHHARPRALIGTPTALSLALIATLVFLPALLASDPWHAVALTAGVLAGYLVYALTHHATHHWRADSAWARQRKQRHALHHHGGAHTVCYGVTSSLWDHVFRSAPPKRRQDAPA